MATGGMGFNKFSQENWTANEGDGVEQNTCQKFTREHQDPNVQVQNRKEKVGFFSRIFGNFQSWLNHPVSQCSYIDCDESVTSYKIIHRSVIMKSSEKPYTFKFHNPTHIITGIVCGPKDAKTSSPEAEVISGGIGCKEVQIVLTPVVKGDWCCCVQINGIEGNRLEMNVVPN